MGITTQSGELAIAAADTPALGQDTLYERVNADFAAPLVRLARAHEADSSPQQDLLQEIHIALWRSLSAFGGRCSLRTWVYRVAHNAAASYVLRRQRRFDKHLVDLDDVEIPADAAELDTAVDEARMVARIHGLVQQLKPLDRQIFVLYLEGLSMEDIAEIAGLSQVNTRTKLHRIRALLAARLGTGEPA